MRIDMPQLPDNSVLQVRTRAGAYTHSLGEGDVIKAEVLSGENGAVVMRAEGGQIFRARLESGVALSRGDELFLQVTGKEEGIIYLSVREGLPVSDAARLDALTSGFEDKSLALYAGKLAQLNMTVTEDTARIMRDLMVSYPEMSLDEAAFIAENKLHGDAGLINAAMSLLSGEEKTDAMIGKLMELLASLIATETDAPDASLPGAAPQIDAKPADVLSYIETLAAGETSDAEQAAQPDARIIPQDDNGLQFRIDSNVEENSQNVVSRVEISTQERQNQPITPEKDDTSGVREQTAEVREQGAGSTEQGIQGAGAGSPDISGLSVGENTQFGSNAATAALRAQATDAGEQGSGVRGQEPGIREDQGIQAAVVSERGEEVRGQETVDGSVIENAAESSLRSSQLADISSRLAAAISTLPEFRGTPPSVVERFSDMLQRVAADSADVKGGDNEKLADLLAKLLTKVERNDANAGEKLKNARQEIFARLALLEEAIARAAPPAKAEITDQTRRLMDHVRLLNNIEQFAYMQLPVMLGEQRRTAELYLFKRRGGGKKIDPDNVNILLALDLEHMGRWEALLNIRGKDVSIHMEVDGAAEKDFLGRNTVLLHEMLEEAGFRLVNADISYSEEAEEPTTPLTALRLLDKYSTGRIDYVV